MRLSDLKWLSMPEACEYARLSRNTVKKYIEDGHFTGDKLPGGQWRIDRESIDDYLGQTAKKALALLEGMI